LKLPRQATFFGVANEDDRATDLSAKYLVQPLYESLKEHYSEWNIEAIMRDEATKSRLLRLLGKKGPALLFTASHGLEFPLDHARQVPHQGALLCQDWPGPNAWRGDIPQDFYLAGDDVGADTNLLGKMAFFFACYGAGTPLYDEFSKQAFKERRETIARRPFVAALPNALLNRPTGGALAVIGHVERAWGASFLNSRQSGGQTVVFESAIERLLKGHPVGSAMEYFDSRYAALSTELTVKLEGIDFGEKYDPYDLAALWTANNDARSYVIIGDPAARLNVAQPGETASAQRDIQVQPVRITSASPGQNKELAKPPGLTDEDWRQTPPDVKKYIQRLLDQVN
jgi:hypothetical protein